MASSSRASTAYKQLQQALDTATKHATTLRGDLSKNPVFKDLEKRLTELRKEFGANGRKMLADLEEAVTAATGRKPAARKPAARKPAARKTAAAKPAARKTAARKTAAAKPAARKTAARKPAARKPAAKRPAAKK
ncbi:MAG: Histone H1-like nucleoprotein [Solirubrobacteraceae bacterium]|nr:Histone H1-like nucleoprotein [Solirubrobacteraceae bacterium]